MYARSSPQASVHEESVPFAAALALSVIATLAALARIGGCFLPVERRPWQLCICILWSLSSIGILGVASSGKDDIKHQQAYNVLLLIYCCLSMFYEGEFMVHLYANLSRKIQIICFCTILLLGLITVGLCVGSFWLSIRSTLIGLLSTSSGAYLILFAGYLYQFGSTDPNCTSDFGRYSRAFLLGNAVYCFFVLVLIVTFCILGSIGKIPGELTHATWIYFTVSTICSLRFTLFQGLKKEPLKFLSGTRSQHESSKSLQSYDSNTTSYTVGSDRSTLYQKRLSGPRWSILSLGDSLQPLDSSSTELSSRHQTPIPPLGDSSQSPDLNPPNNGPPLKTIYPLRTPASPPSGMSVYGSLPNETEIGQYEARLEALEELNKLRLNLPPSAQPDYQPSPTNEGPLPPQQTYWCGLAREIDFEWDPYLPSKRKGVRRATREPRFRVHRKRLTSEAMREKTELCHSTPRKAKKPECRARL